MSQKATLAGQGLRHIDEFIPDLASNPTLTELDLSNNQLQSLPASMATLVHIRSLNLCNNNISNFESLVAVLRSMPGLESLDIDISGPNQDDIEDTLILGLPGLKFFNGLNLVDDESDVATGGNPPSAPAAPAAASDTLSAAANTPVGAARQSQNTAASAATAETVPASSREISLEQSDLESAALLFGAVKNSMGQLTPQQEETLAATFDQHVRSVVQTLKTKLDGVVDPFIRKGEILMAKHQLYEVCFAEIVNVAQASNPKFGDVLRQMRNIHKDLFSEFPHTLHEMRPHYLQRLADMKSQCQQAEHDAKLLLEAAEVLEKEALDHTKQREALEEEIRTQREQLRDARSRRGTPPNSRAASTPGTSSMRREERQPPSSFAAAMAPPPPQGATPGGGAFGPASGPPSSGPKKRPQRVLSLKQLKDNFISLIYDSKMKFDKKCKDAHLPRETMEMHMYTFLNQRYGLKSLIVEHASAIIQAVNKYSGIDNDVMVFGKIIRNEIDEEFRFVQKELKETVVELLRVKLKGANPLKTDEQINELVSRACAGYVEDDEWKDIIKYMYNHEDALSVMVLVEECIHLQPPPIAPLRMPGAKVRGRRRASVANQQREAEAAVSGGRVPFEDFLKILLDFQLRGHEKFLSKFRRLFREADADKNGVINEAEFRHMVRRIDPGKSEAEVVSLIELVDPYNNQHVTFSEAVGALSSELVSLMTSPMRH